MARVASGTRTQEHELMRVTVEISEAAAEALLRAEAADFGHESVATLLRRRRSTRREAVQDVVQCMVDARVKLSYEREDA